MISSRGRGMLAVLAMWAVIASGVGAWGHGLGARQGTAEERAQTDPLFTEVRTVAPNAFSRARATAEGTLRAQAVASRPAAVDNSALSWFPPIGDQGEQNSCAAWAAGYYYDTYTQAMDEGLDVSRGDPAHTCSPAFLYPLINDGADDGAYIQAAVALLNVTGCSSLALTPWRETDYTTWPSESAWVDALSRRTQTAYRISDHTATGLEAVKQLLANGRVAILMIDMYANLYYSYPAARGADSDVLYAADGPWLGGHAVTLVGYDDTKSYQDARDGRIHTGAFLLANSWGSTWGVTNTKGSSQGYFWIAYDAFLERAFVYDVYYTDDRAHYRPALYALVGIDADQRGAIDLRGGAGLPSSPTGTTQPVLHYAGGTRLGLSSSQRIAVDLTDLVASLPVARLSDFFVSLGVSVSAPSAGAIRSAEFFADTKGDGTLEHASAAELPVTVRQTATGYAFVPLFQDVNWDSWAYTDIEACYDAGVVGGYPDDTYHPEVGVTRAQMAVYISRALAGGDAAVPAGPATATFTDVPTDFWAYQYVECAVTRGIVQGYRDGTYQPDVVVDRGAMAAYIARAMAGGDSSVPDLTSSASLFPDVPADFWSARYVRYVQQAGVITGYADGKYHPEYTVTRDMMATYIARAFHLES